MPVVGRLILSLSLAFWIVAVANDPQFHKIVDDIHAILERDADGSQLLAAAHAQLVKPSR